MKKCGAYMILQHQGKQETLCVRFRDFEPKDAPAVIACIRDAYGDGYIKPYLYDEQEVASHDAQGILTFALAETDAGDIAGMTAAEVSEHFPQQVEIACQVVRRMYSGYGLALPLASYQMRAAEANRPAALFARALGCHLISQKTLDAMGFTHCGFLLSVFSKELFTHHYENGAYLKISQSVAVKRVSKRHVGQIWIPQHLLPLATQMYDSLGLPFTPTHRIFPLSGEGRWDWEWNGAHHTLTLWVRRCGTQFATKLRRCLEKIGGHPLATVNLYLNQSDLSAGSAWEIARKCGFLFTGFLPCGGAGEYLILHWPGAVPVCMNTIPYIAAYEPYAAEIRRQLNERT